MTEPGRMDLDITQEVRQYLLYLKEMGCTSAPLGEDAQHIVQKWGGEKQVTAGHETHLPEHDSLDAILSDLAHCRRCRLADSRKAVICGQGTAGADIMFIGPFPEPADADSGMPYSGETGQLLTRIIEAMGQSRQSVYICHAVKCRPPEERLPDRFEARACRIWLKRQIRAVSPKIICALGGFAAQNLLGTDEPISRLRGRFHDYEGIAVMPTHEPAYLLVHPKAKRAVWEDMKQVMARLTH
ncbi:MAG: uracil-DNA glycosylase [Desulfosalsimonas sp.]|uniref:uracil-DNA glycosylase n=1 Tax=Desulfosalsimonas sp. TaxID=3073848 RepID=UPI0039710491